MGARKTDDWMHFQSAIDLKIDLDQWTWLKRYQPDVISVHQIMNLGLDILFRLRALFPKACLSIPSTSFYDVSI